jgi:hypothetical protein
MSIYNSTFPSQKKLEKQKNQKWAKECVKSACDVGIYNEAFNSDYHTIRTNMDLYNNTLNIDDMMAMCDPYGIAGNDIPFKPQHYPIANSKINLLVGEEMKKRFDWKVKVINDDAVSEKEKEIMQMIRGQLTQLITSNLSEEEATRKLKEFDNYLKFEYQDVRERKATHLLNHMIEKENMKYKWNMGFLDGLVGGREIYALDIVGGDPRVRKCNPANVRVIRKGYSPDIIDADIIIEWGYHSRGNVIDMYFDDLDEKDVKRIEEIGQIDAANGAQDDIVHGKEPNLMAGTFSMAYDANGKMVASDMVDTNKLLKFVSEDGSILVTRVVWASYRKIGKLKYYDNKTGNELYKWVDEFYIPNIQKGEVLEKYIWAKDWWEGTRIGEDIYCRMKPFPVKAYGISNPTGTLCPYVGGDYTVDGEPTTSLMGRLKQYAYYYDFMMYKQWETISKHKGTIGYLDLASIPEGMEVEDVLYYADRMGWLPIDSFKEGNKGQSTGKLAGNINANRSPMNFDMGNYLQQNMMVLNFLKEEMGNISGVSRQREGTISSSELVGNTERAVTQSSHVTEMYFHFHDRIKVSVMKAMLEVAKHAYKGRTITVQYILDDMSQVMSQIDGDEFREVDHGITISNNPEYSKIYNAMQQLAQAGLQNDKVNFSQILDILTDPSISSVRRKIESAEQQKTQRDQEAAQRQSDDIAKQSEVAKQIEEMKLQSAKDMELFKAQQQAFLEQVRTNGNIDLAKVNGLIKQALQDSTSGDMTAKLNNDIEKLGIETEHESIENEKDRLIEEKKIAAMKSKQSKSA